MNIVYALNKSSQRYYYILFASLRSLFRVHKKKLNVYLLHSNLTESELKKLNALSKSYGQSIQLIEFPESKYKKELSILMKVQEKFSNMDKGTYYRLFIAELIPEHVDRVLYLDCDTLINKNLESFYNTNFEGNSIIAITDVQDEMVWKSSTLARFDRYYNYKKKFNAGIFILNLKSVRKNFLGRCLKVAETLKFLLADQDILNIVFIAESKILDRPEFNLIASRRRIVNISLEKAHVIHLAGDLSTAFSLYNKEIKGFIGKNYKDLIDIPKSDNKSKITRFLEKNMPPRIYDLLLISVIAFKIVILNKEPSQPLFE